jgi:hypothetical protein
MFAFPANTSVPYPSIPPGFPLYPNLFAPFVSKFTNPNTLGHEITKEGNEIKEVGRRNPAARLGAAAPPPRRGGLDIRIAALYTVE